MKFKLWNKKKHNWSSKSAFEEVLGWANKIGILDNFKFMVCSEYTDKNNAEIIQGHVVTHPDWGATPHLIDFMHGSLRICTIQEEPFPPTGVAFLDLEQTINMEVIGHVLEDPSLLYVKQDNESQQRLDDAIRADDRVDF